MKRRPHEWIHVERDARDQAIVVLEQWLEGNINTGLLCKSLKKIRKE